jgi:hypothetical protein
MNIYYGVVNDNHVRVRNEAGINGKIISSINQGEEVSVLGRSKDRIYLDGFDSFWLKIKKNNIEGWSYGAYINLRNFQYESLPILDERETNVIPNLNYSRDLSRDELIDQERATLQQQNQRFFYSSIQEFYDNFAKVFYAKQNLRPFFLNSVVAGMSETDRFFVLSASSLCDFIQTNYSDALQISEYTIHNDNSATFWISGIKEMSNFIGIRFEAIIFNIILIRDSNIDFLEEKVIIDDIIISPVGLRHFGGNLEQYIRFMKSPSFYFVRRSEFLDSIVSIYSEEDKKSP